MKTTLTQQRLFATLFVTIAILALTPTLAHADQPSQFQTISLDLTGQATAIGSGPSGASTLKLTGDAYTNSNKWLIIQNITGSLQIGPTTIQITGGQGSVKNAGATAIFADTNSGKGQLILIGTMNDNNTATFNSPESQLASMSYLSLSGTVSGTTGNSGMNPGNASTNSTSLTAVPQNNTNTISTSSAVKFQNATNIAPLNLTSTTSATVTSSMTLTTIPPNNNQTTNSTTISSTSQVQTTTSVASGNTTLMSTTNANVTSATTLSDSTSSTATGSSNIPPSAAQAPSNITVTVTRYVNQTVSVTQTVANVTISYTVTSTVANTTITQANVTTTANSTTTTST